jgi:hypothetical protein
MDGTTTIVLYYYYNYYYHYYYYHYYYYFYSYPTPKIDKTRLLVLSYLIEGGREIRLLGFTTLHTRLATLSHLSLIWSYSYEIKK